MRVPMEEGDHIVGIDGLPEFGEVLLRPVVFGDKGGQVEADDDRSSRTADFLREVFLQEVEARPRGVVMARAVLLSKPDEDSEVDEMQRAPVPGLVQAV